MRIQGADATFSSRIMENRAMRRVIRIDEVGEILLGKSEEVTAGFAALFQAGPSRVR